MKTPKASHVALGVMSAGIVSFFATAGVAGADEPPPQPVRGPVGIYALVPLEKAITAAQISAYYPVDYHKKKDPLPPYPNPDLSPDPAQPILVDNLIALVANPAVSGLAIRVYWSTLNPPDSLFPTRGVLNWAALDDAFDAVRTWNLEHPTQLHKTVQLAVVPGFWSPAWVLTLPGMTSCEPLFSGGSPGKDCGYAIFTNSEGAGSGDPTPLPLPWSDVYKDAWHDFLVALNEHIQTYPADEQAEFVSIAIAGPTSSSVEMRLPNPADDTLAWKWNSDTPTGKANAGLLGNRYKRADYQNTDQAFIEEWNHAIDMYSKVFSDVTLIATTGDGLPDFGPAPDPIIPGFGPDCKNSKTDKMDCRAEVAILAHLADPTVGGTNAKATQTSGVIASRRQGGHMGQVGVKWLDAITSDGTTKLPGSSTVVSRVLGGLQFDTSFSDPKHMQHEGCFHKSSSCTIKAEQALFDVLQTVFTGTAAGDYYAESTILTPPGKTAPFNYLQIYDTDIAYATGHQGMTVSIENYVTHTTFGTLSAQDLLNEASSQILYEVSEPIILNPAIVHP